MREIRLEELDETKLPEIIQSTRDISKDCPRMETPKLTPEDKRDSSRTGIKSNYREDEALKTSSFPFRQG